MGNARTCDMQKKLHTSKMQDNTIIMLMWYNAWDFKLI